EAERKLTSGGVPDHKDSRRIEIVAFCDLRDEAIPVRDVFECAGPSTTGITDAPVFQIPGGDSLPGECGTQVPGVRKIILGAPEASMNVHRNRKWSFALGQSQIAELIRIGAVGQANIGGRWREREDVFGHGVRELILAGDARKRCRTHREGRRGHGERFKLPDLPFWQFLRDTAPPPCLRPIPTFCGKALEPCEADQHPLPWSARAIGRQKSVPPRESALRRELVRFEPSWKCRSRR